MRESSITSRGRHPFLLLIAGALAPLFISGFGLTKLTAWLLPGQMNNTSINHSVVVEKVQNVAKLVSSETSVRDVVTYEDTWYGSTKRPMVVVTGTVQAGINLDAGSSVQIDDNAKRIAITLPEPGVLGIGITDLKTYDEQRGLWNAFTPADRDALFQRAREQLEKTSRELKITEVARQSASELLQGMFSSSGYTTDVSYQ